MFKKIVTPSLLSLLIVVGSLLPASVASAAFNSSLVMDDTVFDNTSSMTANQIDAFLNQQPNSCISTNNGFSSPDPTGYSPSTGYTYGANVSAGKVIDHVSEAYGLNPQVILATLQKEQSLVTGSAGCHPNTPDPATATPCNLYGDGTTYNCTSACPYNGGCMNIAVGYGCPYNCNADQEGFTKQLIRAAWMLKFAEQRSEGNVSWNVQKTTTTDSSGNSWVSKWDNSDDPTSCYSGNMTQGTFARCSGGTSTYYDGYATIDGTSLHLDTGATVALYRFTPHFSGNQSFYNIFSGWFGGTISSTYYSCHNASNISTAPTGEGLIPNKTTANQPDKLSLIIPNNTGSSCVEMHTWADSSYQSWIQHTASNSPAINPANSKVISADLNGSGSDVLYKVDYTSTSSGQIEFHGWDSTDLHWIAHIASNRAAINPADSTIISADMNGDGKDEVYLVQYRNTGSGNVEVHGWTSDFQNWSSHIATVLPAIDPTQGKIISADMNGDGKDELIYVKYAGTQSGRIEFHVFTPNLQGWSAHIASNYSTSGFDPTKDDIIAANVAPGKLDQVLLVEYSGTSSAKVEVHGWTSDFQNWSSHIATNQGSF